MIRFKINFKGRVQGVGFRFQAFRIANDLNITGSVQNMYDGSVLVYAQGSSGNIDSFVNALCSERFIHVDTIDKIEVDLCPDETSFKILY